MEDVVALIDARSAQITGDRLVAGALAGVAWLFFSKQARMAAKITDTARNTIIFLQMAALEMRRMAESGAEPDQAERQQPRHVATNARPRLSNSPITST